MAFPLTRILVKVYALKFYKANNGWFLFLFVTLIVYLFFINVLNETHLPDEQVTIYHLLFVLTLITTPVMMLLVFVIMLLYTFKNCKFILTQSALAENNFLYYSTTAIRKTEQYRSWFLVQLIIFLPFMIYGFFSVIVGITYHYYVLPIVIILFIALLILLTAWFAVWHINKFVHHHYQSLVRNLAGLPKPLGTLFLYHVVDKQKITYLITKIVSFAIVSGGVVFLPDIHVNLQIYRLQPLSY